MKIISSLLFFLSIALQPAVSHAQYANLPCDQVHEKRVMLQKEIALYQEARKEATKDGDKAAVMRGLIFTMAGTGTMGSTMFFLKVLKNGMETGFDHLSVGALVIIFGFDVMSTYVLVGGTAAYIEDQIKIHAIGESLKTANAELKARAQFCKTLR